MRPSSGALATLDRELRRVFDICNGCRRCLPLCPSFKDLFELARRDEVDGEADRLPAADMRARRRPLLPVQALLQPLPVHAAAPVGRRLPAADAARPGGRRRGSGRGHAAGPHARQHRAGRPPRQPPRRRSPTGRTSNRAHRALMQKIAGIHRDRNLPRFHRRDVQPLVRGASARRRRPAAAAAAQVALFATCRVEYNDPAIGRATVAVLEHNGVDVDAARAALLRHAVPRRRRRRGGRGADARQRADAGRGGRARAARSSSPGPTCAYMLKQEYPWLRRPRGRPGEWRRRRATCSSTWPGLHAEGGSTRAFRAPPGRVTYHVALSSPRARTSGPSRADVLRLMPGADGARDRALLGRRRHLGLQDGVLRPVAEGGQAAVRADRRGAAGPHRHRLPARRAADRPGHRAGAREHPIQILADAYGLRRPDADAADPARRDPEPVRVREGPRRRRRREVIALKAAPARRGRATGSRSCSRTARRCWFQIQEMIRAERIVDDAQDARRRSTSTTTLLPGPGELSATMFIEIDGPDRIKPELDRFIGIDDGPPRPAPGRPAVAVPGEFEAGHSDEELGKLAAVHFVRFALPEPARRAFARAPSGPGGRAPELTGPGRSCSDEARGRAARGPRSAVRRLVVALGAALALARVRAGPGAQPGSRARPPDLPRPVHRLPRERPRPARPRRPAGEGKRPAPCWRRRSCGAPTRRAIRRSRTARSCSRCPTWPPASTISPPTCSRRSERPSRQSERRPKAEGRRTIGASEGGIGGLRAPRSR